jgi:NAD(P)-dependent dehydrogenase (short-subunit alcohol dehydrogenase family)
MMGNRSLFDLEGKVAIVTGASKGIGKSIATHLALAGACVVVSSRRLDACEQTTREIVAAGGRAHALACNVSSRDEIDRLVDATLSMLCQVDVLVCNAAVNPYYGSLAEIPETAYDKIMDTNVKMNLHLCRRVRPSMAARGGGSIVIVSSIAGVRGSADIGAYGLSKAADMQLARNLAVEWGPQKIRVNCIAPGLIRTGLSRARWEDPAQYSRFIQQYPIGRIGEPEDVAGAAVFLASRSGEFVTGQTIFVDGGATIAGG